MAAPLDLFKEALNRIDGSKRGPMLARESLEGQAGILVTLETFNRRRITGFVFGRNAATA